MLEISLLARFEIHLDGDLVELPSRQAQSLLAYLLLNMGMRHRRDKIAGMIWPESEEPKARGKLRYALWRLRKSLGESYFVADKISLGFNSESEFWLDTAVLDKKLDSDPSAEELKKIVSVYKGELLPGFYEEWVLLERERLLAAFEHRMEQFLRRLLTDGSWREVLEWAETWIAMGQVPEAAYRGLMIAHARLGDAAGAEAAYVRGVQKLREQLAVDPSKETRELHERILRGESLDRAPLGEAVPLGVAEGAPAEPSFFSTAEPVPRKETGGYVGREDELSRLEKILLRARRGRGQVLFIAGEAGRGKTALLREFGRQAQKRWEDLIVASGQAESQTGIGDPNLPFRDVLALLCGDVQPRWESGDLSRENAERLWHLIPLSTEILLEHAPDLIDRFISGRRLIARGAVYAPQGARWLDRLKSQVEIQHQKPIPINVSHGDPQTALFEQYLRMLHELAREHPLLLILDDLHWADSGSIAQLFHLSRRIEGHRILVVGAYRPEVVFQDQDDKPHPLAQVISEAKHTFGEIEIDLDRFDEQAGHRFIDAVLDRDPNRLAESFRDELYARTGAHPLFTIELLEQLKAEDELFKDGEGRWTAAEEIDWEKIPAKVDAVIEGRVGQVPREMRGLLNLASVEGERFTAEVLARATQRDVASVVQSLSQELDRRHHLVEAHDIQRVGPQRISRYRFRHHLFQKYLLENLDPIEKAQLHQVVGEALEELYDDRKHDIAVNLAMHFDEAGVVGKAFEYRFEAGEQAKSLSANHEAIYHFDRAHQLFAELPEDQQRVDRELALQLSRGSAWVAIGGWASPEVEEIYARARVLSEQAGETEQLVYALWGLWSFYLTRPKHREAIKYAERILRLAMGEEDPTLVMVGHWTRGISHMHLGEFALARDHLERAVALYDLEKHASLSYRYGQNPGITCLTYLAIDLSVMGDLDQALEISRQTLALVERDPHLFSKAFGYGLTAGMYSIRGEPEQALANAEKSLSIAKEKQYAFFFGLSSGIKGWALAEMGDPRAGIEALGQGPAAMQSTGAELGQPYFLTLFAQALIRAGNPEAAQQMIQLGMSIAERNDEHWIDSELNRVMGTAYDLRGSAVEARKHMEQAIAVAEEQGAKLFAQRGRAEIAELPGQD